MNSPVLEAKNSPTNGKAPVQNASSHPKSDEKPVPNAPKSDPLQEKNRELTELLQRTRAEFENYQKRVEREKPALMAWTRAETIHPLLAVWDSFDHALEKASETDKKGIEPLARQFRETLQKMGVHPMQTIGKPLDPQEHDCLLTESDPQKPDGIVLGEIQKGFFLNGSVLRHAKVKVNRIETEPKKTEPKNEEKK